MARILIRKIHNGEYAPGDRLESIRTLAERYEVGRQVMSSAFSLMAKQNYIYTVHGSGTYVNPRLKVGLYYRLGWFDNQLNPAACGITMQEAYMHAARRHFTLISGSNYEESFTFADWLTQKNDLDGVVVTGIVNEELLKFPRQHKIPYMVLGNYDISAEHPQTTYDVYRDYYDCLAALFREHQWKTFGVIGGTPDFRADREAMDGIRDAARDAGMDLAHGSFGAASDDGYKEVVAALKKKPEILIFCGSHWLGLMKYCERYPEFRRPVVVINGNQAAEVPDELYDYKFKLNAYSTEWKIVHTAVDALIDTIKTTGKGEC
jgi:DNA-binding LacI/PurR family transcriptional regulator